MSDWRSYFDTRRVLFISIIFAYLRCMYMYLCFKQSVGLLFFVSGHLVASFFSFSLDLQLGVYEFFLALSHFFLYFC